jgi:hypothetical protein
MNAVLRLRKSYFALGIVGLVMLLAMAAFSYYAAITDVPADRRAYFLILTLGVWGFMTCLDLWLLLACWREQLLVQDDRMIRQGVFSTKELSWSEIVEARWRVIPAGGSVVLKTATDKMKVEFSNFEREQSLFLIRHLWKVLPSFAHRDWPLFCYKIALPMSKSLAPQVERGPHENEVRITRRRWDWYFLPGILLAAAIGVYLWQMFGLSRSLIGPLPLIALWLFVRWGTPKQGMLVPTSPEDRQLIAWFSLTLLSAFPLMYISKQLEKQHPALGFVALLPLLAFFPVIIRMGVRKERRQKERALEATPAAVEEWERQEAASGS